MNTKTASSVGSNILLWILSVGLVLYTAFRSVHLVQSTLPGGNAQIMGYFALFGLDFALFIWLIYATRGARTPVQVWVSTIMIYVQIVGIVLAVIADTLLVFNSAVNASLVGQITGWFIPVVIGINVAAGITCKLFSYDRDERFAENAFQDAIADQVNSHMRDNAAQYAQSIAPVVAARRLAEMMAAAAPADLASGDRKALLDRIQAELIDSMTRGATPTPAAAFSRDASLSPGVSDAAPETDDPKERRRLPDA